MKELKGNIKIQSVALGNQAQEAADTLIKTGCFNDKLDT